jgi:penicillin V acylase-like amidase (Ntn superfamily)
MGYGSVTFNQCGREFPHGGMNEAGLVVELMWFDGTRYPPRDGRQAVSELSWIQYMLDTCATTAEVVDMAARVRIAGSVPIHFLVADRSGASASIEFIDGKLASHGS